MKLLTFSQFLSRINGRWTHLHQNSTHSNTIWYRWEYRQRANFVWTRLYSELFSEKLVVVSRRFYSTSCFYVKVHIHVKWIEKTEKDIKIYFLLRINYFIKKWSYALSISWAFAARTYYEGKVMVFSVVCPVHRGEDAYPMMHRYTALTPPSPGRPIFLIQLQYCIIFQRTENPFLCFQDRWEPC